MQNCVGRRWSLVQQPLGKRQKYTMDRLLISTCYFSRGSSTAMLPFQSFCMWLTKTKQFISCWNLLQRIPTYYINIGHFASFLLTAVYFRYKNLKTFGKYWTFQAVFRFVFHIAKMKHGFIGLKVVHLNNIYFLFWFTCYKLLQTQSSKCSKL